MAASRPPNVLCIPSSIAAVKDGFERIRGIRADGTLSAYGCGWNVLAYLGIVSRAQAQAEVNAIVAAHDSGRDHAGLMIIDICQLITERLPAHPPCHRYYMKLPRLEDRVGANIQRELQAFLPIRPESFVGQGTNFFYSIMKLVMDETTGLGHTILLFYELKADGLYISTYDPQLNRLNDISTFGDYLAKSGAYVGVSVICGGFPAGGRGGKSKRFKRKKSYKKKRSIKIGGGKNPLFIEAKSIGPFKLNTQMKDPEFGPLSDSDYKLYSQAINSY